MLKQFYDKIFGSQQSAVSCPNQNRSMKAPIYSIPSISSSFQQSQQQSFQMQKSSTDQNMSKSSNSSTSSISPASSLSSKSSASNNQTTSSSSTWTKPSSTKNSKFSDSTTRQIYIAPHCIKYTNSTLDDTIYRIDDESLNEIAIEILESDNLPPKLQIVLYDGKYYSINNSHLQIYKQLQLSGLITHVQADLISVEAIPLALRQHLLQAPSLDVFNNPNDTEQDDSKNEDISPITNNGLADVILPSSIDMLSKEMLIDETYEFGECENCIDSDDEANSSTNSKSNQQRKHLNLNKNNGAKLVGKQQEKIKGKAYSNEDDSDEHRDFYEEEVEEDDDDDDQEINEIHMDDNEYIASDVDEDELDNEDDNDDDEDQEDDDDDEYEERDIYTYENEDDERQNNTNNSKISSISRLWQRQEQKLKDDAEDKLTSLSELDSNCKFLDQVDETSSVKTNKNKQSKHVASSRRRQTNSDALLKPANDKKGKKNSFLRLNYESTFLNEKEDLLGTEPSNMNGVVNEEAKY